MLISRCGFSFIFKTIFFLVTFLTFTDQIKLMEISCVDMWAMQLQWFAGIPLQHCFPENTMSIIRCRVYVQRICCIVFFKVSFKLDQRFASVWYFCLWNLQNNYFKRFFNPRRWALEIALYPLKFSLWKFCLIPLFFFLFSCFSLHFCSIFLFLCVCVCVFVFIILPGFFWVSSFTFRFCWASQPHGWVIPLLPVF